MEKTDDQRRIASYLSRVGYAYKNLDQQEKLMSISVARLKNGLNLVIVSTHKRFCPK